MIGWLTYSGMPMQPRIAASRFEDAKDHNLPLLNVVWPHSLGQLGHGGTGEPGGLVRAPANAYLYHAPSCGGTGQAHSAVAAVAGFFTNSAVVGLYALFVQFFPTEVRAGDTGFVIGVGRGGAVLGPIIAGFLFREGRPLSTVSAIMGAGSIVAATGILCLRHSSGHVS
jgi:hypothetical protein